MEFNGDNLILKIDIGSGPEIVAVSTDCKLSFDMSAAKATTKDSGGWEQSIAGNAKWSVSTNGMVDYHPSAGYLGVGDLSRAAIAKQLITVYFQMKSPAGGDLGWTGQAYITKIEQDAKQGTVVTYSCDLEGTGALSEYAA
jgi:predicted secreted protein